jgi:hypothetical protein
MLVRSAERSRRAVPLRMRFHVHHYASRMAGPVTLQGVRQGWDGERAAAVTCDAPGCLRVWVTTTFAATPDEHILELVRMGAAHFEGWTRDDNGRDLCPDHQ